MLKKVDKTDSLSVSNCWPKASCSPALFTLADTHTHRIGEALASKSEKNSLFHNPAACSVISYHFPLSVLFLWSSIFLKMWIPVYVLISAGATCSGHAAESRPTDLHRFSHKSTRVAVPFGFPFWDNRILGERIEWLLLGREGNISPLHKNLCIVWNIICDI